MSLNWIRRGNEYFSSSWATIRYQPILYLFVLGGTVRLWLNNSEPPAFQKIIAPHFYGVWLTLGIVGPLAALLAWILIEKRSGRARFIGMWLRLAADIMVGTVIATYHAVSAFTMNGSETQIFARYMVGTNLFFVAVLVVRDIWTLVVTERIAGQIHRGER